MDTKRLLGGLKPRSRGETVIKSFRLPKDLSESLEKICEKRGLSLSELVIAILDEAHKDYQKRDR